MKVEMNNTRTYSFSSNNKDKNKSKKSIINTKFLLAYASMCAVFPYDIDKYVDKIDINFKQLPIKDKAKNIAKAAIPFFGYTLILLCGLKVAVDLINKELNLIEKTNLKDKHN